MDAAGSQIVQRALTAALAAGQPDFHCLSVQFHPQHEFEEVFEDAGEPQMEQSKTDPGHDKTRRPPAERRRLIGPGAPELARTRLAEGSRLVFRLPARGPAGVSHPLTLDWLTDWEGATLVVNRRAMPRSAGLQEQLELTGITPATPRAEARRLVKHTILGAHGGLPGPFETAIEPVYRMIVSPDESARFRSTPPGVKGSPPVLWSAELENDADVATRALWARGMDPALRFLDADGSVENAAFDAPFPGSLESNDRRELVAMSSFYGLAAMRRLIPADSKPPVLKLIGQALGLTDTEPAQWKDDPNGMVFVPRVPYEYLKEQGGGQIPQQGVMLARPFERFRLRMGRAADMDAFWKGEPPAPLPADPFFNPAFTLERYSHRTVQGRDVFVEVIYKGFLFPLGHRAALIKVSYRDYKAFQNQPGGDPTAYLVQELYVVCNKPRKHFRAYQQPFDARDFPCESITMLTTKTGKLAYPNVSDYPGPRDGSRPAGKIFWPRLAGSNQRVIFKYQIDDQNEPCESPLLFVDNAAAHDWPSMQNLVTGYSADPDLSLRTVSHANALRRYAPETRRGQCSFKTRSWLLAARGRFSHADGNQSFSMDAFMEGQDQPPFYPFVESATVNVEAVERLTGQPGLFIETAFNARYVEHGFSGAHNPSEVYIDVISQGVYLNGSNTPGATGGLASMAALLAGLSRKIGPVGGKPAPSVPDRRLAAAAAGPLPGGPVERHNQMGSALNGGFDPLEFLDNAMLLGCIPLKEVCKAALIASAPKLLEQARHGVAAAAASVDDQMRALRVILRDALDAVQLTIRDCRDAIEKALHALDTALALKSLYPMLDHALDRVHAATVQVERLVGAPTVPGLGELQEAASALKGAVEELVHQLEAIARDPMPAIARQALLTLQTLWDKVRNPVGNLLEELAKLVLDQALDQLVATLSGQADRYLLGALFGPFAQALPDESPAALAARLKGLLRNPADLIERGAEALLHDTFGRPLFALLQGMAGAAGPAGLRLDWSRRKVARAVGEAIVRHASPLPAAYLAPVGEQLADRLAAALLAYRGELGGLAAHLDEPLRAALAATRTQARTQLEALLSTFASDIATKVDAKAKYLVKEMNGLVSELERREYRNLLSELRRCGEMHAQAEALLNVLAGNDWKAIASEAEAAVRAEFKRAVAARLAETEALARRKANELADSALDLGARAFDLLAEWSLIPQVQKIGRGVGDVCQASGQALLQGLDRVAFGLIAAEASVNMRLAELDARLGVAIIQVDTLVLPNDQAGAIRASLQAHLSGLLSAMAAVREVQARSSALRRRWEALLEKFACRLALAVELSGAIVAARAELATAIAQAIEAAARCLDGLGNGGLKAAASTRARFERVMLDALVELRALLGDLTGLAAIAPPTPAWLAHKDLLAKVPAMQQQLRELETLARRWRGDAAGQTGPREIVAMARAVQGGFAGLDRRLAGLVIQMVLPQTGFIAALGDAVATIAKGLAATLAGPHDVVAGAIGDFDALLNRDDAGMPLGTLLSQDIRGRIDGAKKIVGDDNQALKRIAMDPAAAVADIQQLKLRWGGGRGGLLLAARLVGDVVELVGSGNIMGMFDVAGIERRLRQAVAALVPTSVSLAYDFDAELSDFPAGRPIFTMDRASYGSDKETRYGETAWPKNDLVLTTRIEIDLLSGERKLKAEGRLRPFTLNLLGGAFDLISLSFGGARFISGAHGKLAIDTQISGVRIGAMLEFLILIQNYFSSGTENGLYHDLQFLPPALEVGYRFNQPYIAIGAMQLLNIGFKVGARLPLDGRQAEFFASMSTREYPLLIAMPPWGGGGFFALRANARGIIAFEIQLEFGFVGGLQIGPLNAQARATAGIYLLQGQGDRVLEGFFHAIGEGHIACFGVGVNIEFKLRQEGDGAMVGSATYAYSFKVGFFKVSFRVNASRRQENGNGEGGAAGGAGSRAVGAPGARKAALAAAMPACAAAACAGPKAPSIVINRALRKETDWAAYKRTLDL